MMTYTITQVIKTGVNQFTDETFVGTFDAEMIGPAKRTASEYVRNYLLDKNMPVRNNKDWMKNPKKNCFEREYMVTKDRKLTVILFYLRET